jgi:phosphohistidine phosphatase SixA
MRTVEILRFVVCRNVRRRSLAMAGIAASAVGLALAAAPSAQGVLPGQDSPAVRASAADATTTIVIVRHAEKATDDPRDPSLSDAGQARAAALATALEGAEVGAIYATQFKRTRGTGELLAKKSGIGVTVRPIANPDAAAYAEALARDVLAKEAGKTVVIIGHSNTVPELVKAFAGRSVPALTEEDYDRLFIVVRPPSGPARLFQTRYGAANETKK